MHTGVVRVAIVDDHQLSLIALKNRIEKDSRLRVVHSSTHINVEQLLHTKVDVLVLDVYLDGTMVSPRTVHQIVAESIAVLLVSAWTSAGQVKELLLAGANALVYKHESDRLLHETVLTLYRGTPKISAEIAEMLLQEIVQPNTKERTFLEALANNAPYPAVDDREGKPNIIVNQMAANLVRLWRQNLNDTH